MTGRDIEEVEHALQFDPQTYKWSLLGEADEFKQTEERREILDCMKAAGRPMKVRDIAEQIGKSRSNVGHLMRKLVDAGVCLDCTNGVYAIRPKPA